MEKIITVFQSLEAFIKMMDDEKYVIEYGYKYQFGADTIRVWKDGKSICDRGNLESKTTAKIIGYECVIDDFLKVHNIEGWEKFKYGSRHIQISQAARNIILPGEKAPTEEQIKEQQAQVDRENEFIKNWNNMVHAIAKYQ